MFFNFLNLRQSTLAAPPVNFQTSLVVGSGLDGPTGFEIAPDGRIFILERTGKMVDVEYEDLFEKKFKKIKDELLKLKVKKQIQKIIHSPEVGTPLQYYRKGTREVYIPPFRLSYAYIKEDNKIVFLDLYHKDEQ